MILSSAQAFEALNDALLRGCSLLSMAHDNPDAIKAIAPRLEKTVVEIFDAYSHLLASDAVPRIQTALGATDEGTPE